MHCILEIINKDSISKYIFIDDSFSIVQHTKYFIDSLGIQEVQIGFPERYLNASVDSSYRVKKLIGKLESQAYIFTYDKTIGQYGTPLPWAVYIPDPPIETKQLTVLPKVFQIQDLKEYSDSIRIRINQLEANIPKNYR